MNTKLFFFILGYYACHTLCVAQTIVNPIFDRSDFPAFRIEEIKVTTDTTFVSCSYHADDDSWANISCDTYLEDINAGTRYRILKVTGIPFSPEKRLFTTSEDIRIILYFPHVSATRINLIENEDNYSFNIYGIDLKNSYERKYSYDDILIYYESAGSMAKKKDWDSAISFTMKQLKASEYIFGIRSAGSSKAMCNLSMEFFEMKDYDKTIEWGKKAIELLNVSPKDSTELEVLACAYESLGNAYKMKGQDQTSLQYMDLAMSTKNIAKGMGILNYEEYLQEMALNYYREENYPKALLYGKEVASIYEEKYKINRAKYGCDYTNSLVNLCEFYQRVNQFKEAITIGERALELIDNGICEERLWLKYGVYNNLAAALATVGKINEGIEYLEKIIEDSPNIQSKRIVLTSRMLLASMLLECKQDTARAIDEYESVLVSIEKWEGLGKPSSEYTSALDHLFKVYRNKDSKRGMYYLNKLTNIQKEWYGDESIAYANSVLKYVLYSFTETMLNDQDNDSIYLSIDSLFNGLQKSIDIIKRHINNTQYYVSKTERADYWKRYESVFTWLIPTICGLMDSPKWNCMAYDASLFYKGLLLSSELDFKNVIQLSNDSALNEIYEKYVNDLVLLENQLSQGEPTIDTDSLKEEIQSIEHLLSKTVTGFDRNNKGTSITWQEVRDHLDDNEIAVEIVSYECFDGTINYDAYAINNKSEYPSHVFLFSDKELRELIYFDSQNYWEDFSKIVWINDSLNNLTKNVNKIYFSASGMLYTFGIEYVPYINDLDRNGKCDLIRLSSTRELCLPRSKKTIENACLFGGLDYNHGASPMNNPTESTSLSRSAVESLKYRGDFEKLPGSEIEIEEIESELSRNSINCTVLKDNMGTEDFFKMMSGSSINLIHLSTHGTYIQDKKDDLVGNNNYNFVLTDEVSQIDDEDKKLTRSFLVMSGGNAIIHRDTISKKNNDGILTALEISHLDFRDLDLVVLSACQTALGDVDNEGVYGLQRGFKKAGANTILMSLDKVDDEATKILMVEFYKNLMNGETKHQSLKNAQKYLRQVENGKYDNPKYWASFIMLDGLN